MAEANNNFIEKVSDILFKNDAISEEEMISLKEDFANRSDTTFENFLIEEGLIPKNDVLQALGEYYNVPAIDVLGIFFSNHLVTMFPEELMKREGFIPYEHDGTVLTVIASNPSNEDLPEIIGRYVSYDVTFLAGIKRDIIDAIEEFDALAPTEVDLDYDRNDSNRGDFEKNSVLKVFKKSK